MKKIIVAPLNWGLGHATRCVPIIHKLILENYIPIIASDGDALAYLQQEFPKLEFLTLPSYNISYKKNITWSLFKQIPKIYKAVKSEYQIINNFIIKNNINGVISDNRFGVYSNKVPSIYITHQLNVLSGFFTFFTSKIHQLIIKNFDECWVPDNNNAEFTGKLSYSTSNLNQKYIGILSRFTKNKLPIKNDVLIILSGIKSQRKRLQQKLINEFENYNGKVVLIEGNIESQQKISNTKGIITYNYMLFEELQKTINESEMIVCRSGYSSIMDLAILQKKVFLIPTSNQKEQEYLAKFLSNSKGISFSSEKNFSINLLKEKSNLKRLESKENKLDKNLFCLFDGK